MVYRKEGGEEVFLARAYAQDLQTEQLSFDEAKASSRKLRDTGKAVSNRSILAEVRDREAFLTQKKSKKERQKSEQAQIHRKKELFPIEAEATEFESLVNELEPEIIEVFDYEEMREDYGL